MYSVRSHGRSPTLWAALLMTALGAGACASGAGGDGDVMPGQELYPRVYMDGTFFGDIDALSRISSDALTSIEFIDGRDATTRFGTGNVAGVIELHSRGLDTR
jgi:hypothetical protein